MATIAVFDVKTKQRLDLEKFVNETIVEETQCKPEQAIQWWEYIRLFAAGALSHSGGVVIDKKNFNRHMNKYGNNLTGSQKETLRKIMVEKFRIEVYG